MMLVFSQYYLIDGFPVDYRSLSLAEQNRVIESNAQLKMLTASMGCRVHPGELVEVHTGFEQGLLYNTLYVCCHTFRKTGMHF